MKTNGPDEGDHAKGSPTLPSRRINPDVKFAHDDGNIDLLARMLRQGDPLADAVEEELQTHGVEARQALEAGLRNGLATLHDAPAAVAALLREAETLPAWVAPEILQRGDATFLSIEPRWIEISSNIAALLRTYSSPSIARLLVGTGRLATMAAHRIRETGTWAVTARLPGALTRGGPGYIATMEVRLLHARVRRTNLRRGWDVETWGVPINQVDLARTWLDFNYVPFRALTHLGFDFTAEELHDLYRFWRYLGYLLGIDPIFYRDIGDDSGAEELLDLIETTNEPPDDNSCALVAALLDVSIGHLMNALKTPPALTTDMVHALARFIHGDALADALGIRRNEHTHLMPLIVHDNQVTRRLQRIEPGAWERMLEQNLAIYRAQLAAPSGPTEFQTYLSAGGR
jgi:hypothetical protein